MKHIFVDDCETLIFFGFKTEYIDCISTIRQTCNEAAEQEHKRLRSYNAPDEYAPVIHRLILSDYATTMLRLYETSNVLYECTVHAVHILKLERYRED